MLGEPRISPVRAPTRGSSRPSNDIGAHSVAVEVTLAMLRKAVGGSLAGGVPEKEMVLCLERAIREVEKTARLHLKAPGSGGLLSSASLPDLGARPRTQQHSHRRSSREGRAPPINGIIGSPGSPHYSPRRLSPAHKPWGLTQEEIRAPPSPPSPPPTPSWRPPPRPHSLSLPGSTLPSLSSNAYYAEKQHLPNQSKLGREHGARAAAHVLGALRQRVAETGEELTRKEFYDVLVHSGQLLAQMKDLAFTDAPDELFDMIDIDGNGTISTDEIEAALKTRLGDDNLAAKVDGLLARGNDVLETSLKDLSQSLAEQAARAIELFKKGDVDGDGLISRSEFRKAAPALGLQGFVPLELDALFDTWDKDGSGELSFREFFRLMRFSERNKNTGPPAASKAKPKIEVSDIEDLRVAVLHSVAKVTSGWSNDVPKTFRAQMNRGRANPSIAEIRLGRLKTGAPAGAPAGAPVGAPAASKMGAPAGAPAASG